MICSVDNCKNQVYYKKKNLCSAHYQRMKKYGDPLKERKRAINGEPQSFFEKKVLHYAEESCLIWPYARDNNGYARMFDGVRMKSVSRMVCERIQGQPPEDRPHAAHSCGKGGCGCVNLRHLRWASVFENMADRTLHKTDNRGERSGSSKITERDVKHIRSLNGVKQNFIALLYGLDTSTINNIISRKRWSWLQ